MPYPTSAEFQTAVRESHIATLRAEVWVGDTFLLSLEPLDGKVDADSRRAIQRTCSLTVAAPEPTVSFNSVVGRVLYQSLPLSYATYTALAAAFASYGVMSLSGTYSSTLVDAGIVPDDAFDALAPLGNEIRLWRGVEIDGSAQEVPLGVFVITSVEITDSGEGTTVSINGSDRAIRIQRARWTEPYAIASGTAVETAISGLLSDRWPDVSTRFTATASTTPAIVFGTDQSSGDPWADAQKLATAVGYRLYFDGDGIAVLEPERDYDSTSADVSYAEGDEAVVLTVRRGLTAEQTYNGVIATGEGTGLADVYRGEAWDDDPASPTYRYGTFGQVPRFYSSPLITSANAAQAAAEAMLARVKGTVETIDWTQIADPSLLPGDVVAVSNTATKTEKVLVIDKLSIPLSPAAPMQATARAIRDGAA